MLSLGIDIGGTSIKFVAIQDGATAWTAQSPSYSRPTTNALVDAIRSTIAGRVAHLDAVGLCVPGLLDQSRRIVTVAVNVPGIVNIPLDDLITHAIGPISGPLLLLNDTTAGAYDLFDIHRLTGRLVALAIGTGVGAAVLDNGQPLHVDGESPGHIGQLDVSLPDEPCIGPDGGAGSLEGYLGIPALQHRYGIGFTPDRFTGSEPACRALVRAIRICHAIYRPHHIALMGGIGIRLAHILPVLHAMSQKNLTGIARPEWTLFCGDTDFHAASGAAKIASLRS